MGNYDNRNNRGGNRPPKQQEKRYRGKNVNPMSGTVQMGQHAVRLIRNLAFGNFSMEKDGVYFQNPEFIQAAIHEVEIKVKEQNIYNIALNMTYGASDDITVLQMINRHMRAKDAWNYVLNTLVGILSTGDMTLLVGLMNRLPDYKYVM